MDQPRNRHVPNTMAERTHESVGCGGTAPSPSLELLGPPPSAAVPATARPSKLRLGYEAVAPQRGPLYFFISLLTRAQRPHSR